MKLPRWQDLPNLDLYLDQVLLYVNQATASYQVYQDKPLTAAMINNYVKHDYLQKPVKKKYSRNQVARLIVLTICKPVFPIPDIVAMIDRFRQESESHTLYDQFINSLEKGTETGQTDSLPIIKKTCLTLHFYQETMAEIQQEKIGDTQHD